MVRMDTMMLDLFLWGGGAVTDERGLRAEEGGRGWSHLRAVTWKLRSTRTVCGAESGAGERKEGVNEPAGLVTSGGGRTRDARGGYSACDAPPSSWSFGSRSLQFRSQRFANAKTTPLRGPETSVPGNPPP